MKSKIKVLFVNEFSQLATGFSTYGNAILSRLYKDDRFEVAELATYCTPNDPRIDHVPWRVYPNDPHPADTKAMEVFRSNPVNQFGAWSFDKVCLEFQPDCVLTIRDYWMDAFIQHSVFRDKFKFIHMTTCDGEPQKQEWLDFYGHCDRLLTYSFWAKELIEYQSNDHIKVFDVASPAVELDIFKPCENIDDLRKSIGISSDANIILSVMRNQPRKLYPEILKTFNKFLDLCKVNNKTELAQNTFLWFHTSSPDVGWDLPQEIRNHKLSHKVLFTYLCKACGAIYPSFYHGDLAFCKNCKNCSAILPNTTNGIDRHSLAKIYQISTILLQYSTNEGSGMSIPEAKACAIPILATEYSAMTEQAHSPGGIPIPVGRMFQEPLNQTNQLRSLPDNVATAQILFDLLSKNKQELKDIGISGRRFLEQEYTWDKIADIWINAILSLDYPDHSKTWLSPPNIVRPNPNIPEHINNLQWLELAYKHILHESFKFNDSLVQKTIVAMDNQNEIVQTPDGRLAKVPIGRQQVLQNMLKKVEHKNNMEMYRYTKLVNPNKNINQIGYITI